MTSPRITAFVLAAPFGPRDSHGHDTEGAAFAHAKWLADHNIQAVALIGEHSFDELQSALRRERKAYVARLAANLKQATA